MTGRNGSEPTRVRIPADVDRPDRILAGLTARQLALLAVPGVVVWVGYVATRTLVPFPVFAVLAAPLAVVAVTVAIGRRDGVGLDQLAVAAWRHQRSGTRHVPAPGGVPPAPGWLDATPDAPPPTPLQLPVTGIDTDGVIDMGRDGVALLATASAVNLQLRTPAEQEALVAGFGRYLNSLTMPVQIVLRAHPVDLTDRIHRLREAAGGLPHPALETAALGHATFLDYLTAQRDLLTRQVLIVFCDPTGGPEAAPRLHRRAADAVTALAAAGITVTVLGGDEAQAAVLAAADPWGEHPSNLAGPDTVISRGAEPA